MEIQNEKKDPLPSLKAIVTLIIATGVIVSGIWAFFFFRFSDLNDGKIALKDEQIALLEKRNTELREFGEVPEAVKRLEERIIPLTLAFTIDPFDARIKLGTGAAGPTSITMHIVKADELRSQKKFDLAVAEIDKIESIYPDFAGTPYFMFLIERDKANIKEALVLAEKAIEALPDDSRILPAYEFAVKANLQNGEKKRAEELCLAAIRLDPKNENWREYFKSSFGYEPTIPENKE